ncbi:MAG: hypothetical protein DRI44_07750 [Chlamydiae bacterium]|nr:MAG: hypothetical protein DRI44_07750 [Chlamydiota bacterium]
MKNKIRFLLIVFVLLLQQFTARSEGLNSDTWIYNPMDYPSDIESLVITGGISSDIEVKIGLSKKMSGITAGLSLNGVNVIAGKSAAGAAWQTSYLVKDPANNDIYVFNQAAGNSTPFSWGYTNYFVKTPGISLANTNWVLNYADHKHPKGDFGSSEVLCPGYGYTSIAVDEGRERIDLSKIPVLAGNVIKIKNSYLHKAVVNQSWSAFSLEKAFYMNRQVAHDKDLNVYLGYYDGSSTNIYKVYLGGADYSVPSNIVYQEQTVPNKSYKIKSGLQYAVFVWQISGKKIGVAIDIPNSLPFSFDGAHLNMERTAYGSNPNDYSNGNISFHPWIVNKAPATFHQGDVNDYYMNYYVGTPEQLGELGYKTETNSTDSNILFLDDFNCPGSGGDANFEYAARQSGAAAPIQYQVVNGPITVTNAGPNAGKLNVLSGAGNLSYWNIANHNFNESGNFSVECEVDRLDGADNFHWFEVSIGCNGAWQNPEDNPAYPGFSIRLWEQGQLVTYTNGNAAPLIDQTFNGLKVSVNPTIKVRIVVSQPDFSGSGDAKIALFINNKALPLSAANHPYTLVLPGGFKNNYINFRVGEANINFDNLKIMTPTSNTITTTTWTSDTDSDIYYTNSYTHVVNLGDTADITINNKTFTGAGILATTGSNWEIRTGNASALNQFTGRATNVDPASGNLLTNFLYPSANVASSLTLTDLDPGYKYVLTLYSMGFENGNRNSYFATSDGAIITVVNQDEFGLGNGQLLTYQYTADTDGTFSISTTPINAGWHLYAFSNQKSISIPEFVPSGFIVFGVMTLIKFKLK